MSVVLEQSDFSTSNKGIFAVKSISVPTVKEIPANKHFVVLWDEEDMTPPGIYAPSTKTFYKTIYQLFKGEVAPKGFCVIFDESTGEYSTLPEETKVIPFIPI